jgi:hypothetical protein
MHNQINMFNIHHKQKLKMNHKIKYQRLNKNNNYITKIQKKLVY